MHRTCRTVALAAALATCFLTQQAWGLGTESFGNEPLNAANYAEWKGIMPLVNDEARVYQRWVNGNEHLLYQGTTEELNAALADFAEVEAEKRIVVLRPGPAVAHSFRGKTIPYNWELHLVGGIAKATWQMDPVLTVFVGEGIELKKLEIPDNVTVVSGASLAKETPEAANLNKKSPETPEEEDRYAVRQKEIEDFLEARKATPRDGQ